MSEARDAPMIFGDLAEKARLDHLLATLPSARGYMTAGIEAAERLGVRNITAGFYGHTATDIDRTIALVTAGCEAEARVEGATADEAFCMVTGMRGTLRVAREAYLATLKAWEGLALIHAGIACLGTSLDQMKAAAPGVDWSGVPGVSPPAPPRHLLDLGTRKASPLGLEDIGRSTGRPLRPEDFGASSGPRVR